MQNGWLDDGSDGELQMSGLNSIPVRDADGPVLCAGRRESQCQLIASNWNHKHVHCVQVQWDLSDSHQHFLWQNRSFQSFYFLNQITGGFDTEVS